MDLARAALTAAFNCPYGTLLELREERDALREALHERTEIFGECISDYERLRGYVARRHGDVEADPRTVAHWMADNGGGLFVEGVPEADAWRARFWPNKGAEQ